MRWLRTRVLLRELPPPTSYGWDGSQPLGNWGGAPSSRGRHGYTGSLFLCEPARDARRFSMFHHNVATNNVATTRPRTPHNGGPPFVLIHSLCHFYLVAIWYSRRFPFIQRRTLS